MSIDASVYIGPYFECYAERVKRVRTVRACPNPQCSLHGKSSGSSAARYCQECGTAIDPKFPEETADWNIRPYEVMGRLGEAIGFIITYDDRGNLGPIHFWRPYDYRREDAGGILIDPRSYQGGIPIDPTRIAAETAAVTREYAAEYARLREAYGPDRVQVRWGVVVWSD